MAKKKTEEREQEMGKLRIKRERKEEEEKANKDNSRLGSFRLPRTNGCMIPTICNVM